MFKLDNDFLQSLGLGGLPVEEKNKLLQMIYERLEMNVGMRLAEKMSDQQLDEFEGFIDRNDEAGALKWLETNFPNYKDVVAEELEKLKVEVQTAAPQILAAHTSAQMPPIAQAPIMPGMPPAPTDSPQQQFAQQPMQPQGMPQQPSYQPPVQPNFGEPQSQYGSQPMPQQPAPQPVSPLQPAYPQFDTSQQQPAPSFQQPAQPQFPPTGGGQGFDPSGPQPMPSQSQFSQAAPQPMPTYQAPAPSVDQSQSAPQPIQPQQPAQPSQDGQFTPPPAGFTPGK